MKRVILIVLSASIVQAQPARDGAAIMFPEAAPLRARVDSLAHAVEGAGFTARDLGSAAAIVDSVRSLAVPEQFASVAARVSALSGGAFAAAIDAATRPARRLLDSARVLRSLEIQRRALGVEPIAGVMMEEVLPKRGIVRIRKGQADVYVELLDSRKIGDSVSLYVERYGRWMMIDNGVWRVAEGVGTPKGAIGELFRERPRPRIDQEFASFKLRYDSLAASVAPSLNVALVSLSASLSGASQRASDRRESLALELESAHHALEIENEYLAGSKALIAGDANAALDHLLPVARAGANYRDASELIARARAALDPAARTRFFGADGVAGMVLVPAGAITLHTGERFRAEAFLIDSLPATNEEYDLFERATGYAARGAWRAGFTIFTKGDPVRSLTSDDRLAFCRWAGKRIATPQELEYIDASGWPSIDARDRHRTIDNLYGLSLVDGAFYCARGFDSMADARRETLERLAKMRAEAVAERVSGYR